MALSQDQRRAINHKNSQRSTGPRTAAGKARSKLNGLKHGLRAATLVLPGEDPAALEQRFDAWTDELDPRTDLERYFVRSAVEASWRLDRVRRAEAAAVARRVTAAEAEADRKDALEVEHSLKFLGLWPEKYLRTLIWLDPSSPFFSGLFWLLVRAKAVSAARTRSDPTGLVFSRNGSFLSRLFLPRRGGGPDRDAT